MIKIKKPGIAILIKQLNNKLMKNAFSLFELLITIALVSILSAISYPLYTQHIARKNREQAEITLLEMANRLEEEYLLNGSYKNALEDQLVPSTAAKLPFQFIVTTPTEHEYFLKAIPTSASTSTSNPCQILTLSSNGEHCW